MPANPTSVQEAREAYDALVIAASENGLISVTIIDAISAYRAAVRAERDAEIRGMVEGMRGRDHDGCGQLLGDTTDADAYLYRADVLRLLSDREGA